MERAARLITKHKDSRKILDESGVARGVWAAAVGPAIARHTSNLRLVRNTLVVDVEDGIWQKQLFALTHQIVTRVQKCMGSPVVQEIEFRIGVPRREPQRAETPHRPESQDEADLIRDPVLKKVYRLSRKRATA